MVTCLASGIASVTHAADRESLPPPRREFASPNGRCRLVVETRDGWKTPRPQATLQRIGAEGRAAELWSRELPHHHGPRAALVSDAGRVLLVDEWISVTSRFTLVLIDDANRTLVTYDHAAVMAALGATWAELGAHARSGTWISDSPTLAPDQRSARIGAAGRVLRVDLGDGALTVER
jgi:hypothetical protein